MCSPYPIGEKFKAFNFHVIDLKDGNDMEQIADAFKEARNTKGMPTAIIAHTVKGKGVSFMENRSAGMARLQMMRSMQLPWRI